MGQNAGKMGKEALVDRKHTLLTDCLEKTVKYASVEVSSLVIHTRHDSIYKSH